MKNPSLSSVIRSLWSLVPLGGNLPDEVWQSRHRFMVGLTWFHAALIALVGPVFGYSWELSLNALFHDGTVLHTFAEGLVVAFFAALAGNNGLSRRWRATATGFGLMSSSAMIVHLSGGYIELHFHFFVMLLFMALYQDWIPYILAVLYVAVHHGMVGVLWPEEVYNHAAALNAPWTWAAIHAFFVLWASIGSIIAWRFNERAFGQARLVLESAGEGIFGLNREGRIIFTNSAATKMLGLGSVHIIGKPITQVLRHTRADGTPYSSGESPILVPLRNGASYHATDEIFWRGDGTNFAVDYLSSPIIERGELAGVVVTFNDITQHKRAEEKERNLRNLLTSLNHVQSLYITDTHPRLLFEELLKDLLTLTQSEYGFIGEVLYNPKGEPYLKSHAITNIAWNEETRAFYEKNAPKGLEFYNLNTLFGAVMTSGRPVIASNPAMDPRRGGLPQGHPALHKFLGLPFYRGKQLMGMVGIANRPGGYDEELVEYLQPLLSTCANIIDAYRNDQQRKQAEEALAEQAIRDALTNLYNRRYFNHRIQEEFTRADRHQQTLAILLCDLDHFKIINDTQGHQSGDKVLKAVAKSIQESTRGTDLVFRWGGDEIVVVLSEVNREGILIVAERIRRGVHKISHQAGIELDMSIGVALYPEHGRGVDELTRLADQALYIAKKGGDKVHIGIEEYHLDEHTIKVVFQPIVDVRSNEVIGYEALSRDPKEKLSILELFKRYQAIGQLNELKCLCFKTQIEAAHKVGLQRVFVNVDFNVLSQLEQGPKPQGTEVILEISELEALYDVENHLKIATKWREAGYQFAIDDFGAGFVSLPFIARLIPEYIKMDRSTVLQAVSSEKFKKFLQDLLKAIQNYSKEGIIAEGIETEKELQLVKSIGIYLIQGFLLGKPQELR